VASLQRLLPLQGHPLQQKLLVLGRGSCLHKGTPFAEPSYLPGGPSASAAMNDFGLQSLQGSAQGLGAPVWQASSDLPHSAAPHSSSSLHASPSFHANPSNQASFVRHSSSLMNGSNPLRPMSAAEPQMLPQTGGVYGSPYSAETMAAAPSPACPEGLGAGQGQGTGAGTGSGTGAGTGAGLGAGAGAGAGAEGALQFPASLLLNTVLHACAESDPGSSRGASPPSCGASRGRRRQSPSATPRAPTDRPRGGGPPGLASRASADLKGPSHGAEPSKNRSNPHRAPRWL